MTTPRSIKHGSLTLALPEGWFDASQVVAMGPEDAGFRASLVVSLEPVQPEETVQQFAARMLPALKKVAEGFSLVGEKPASFGGKEGILREYTYAVEGGRIAQLQFYTLKGGVGFTFTYTQRAAKLPKTREVAEQLFASAQLAGGGAELLRPTFIRG